MCASDRDVGDVIDVVHVKVDDIPMFVVSEETVHLGEMNNVVAESDLETTVVVVVVAEVRGLTTHGRHDGVTGVGLRQELFDRCSHVPFIVIRVSTCLNNCAIEAYLVASRW